MRPVFTVTSSCAMSPESGHASDVSALVGRRRTSHQCLKPRLGHARALGAVKHSMLIAHWHMLTTGETFRDLGGDYFQRRDPARATKRLVAKLQALGHTVTLEPADG